MSSGFLPVKESRIARTDSQGADRSTETESEKVLIIFPAQLIACRSGGCHRADSPSLSYFFPTHCRRKANAFSLIDPRQRVLLNPSTCTKSERRDSITELPTMYLHLFERGVFGGRGQLHSTNYGYLCVCVGERTRERDGQTDSVFHSPRLKFHTTNYGCVMEAGGGRGGRRGAGRETETDRQRHRDKMSRTQSLTPYHQLSLCVHTRALTSAVPSYVGWGCSSAGRASDRHVAT